MAEITGTRFLNANALTSFLSLQGEEVPTDNLLLVKSPLPLGGGIVKSVDK
jgi:hypothetical protein